MNQMTRRIFGMAGFALLLATSASFAQQPPQTVRVRGTIEAVNGGVLTVKSRDGSNLTIKLADNARVSIAVKVPLSEVKVNSYVAVTAMPQADGSQRATEVMIFPEALRGTGEGHGPWDSRPQSTMTNATVTQTVAGVDGETLTVKYKNEEKKIIVPSDAAVITTKPADKSDLKPGVKIFIFAATKQPDGTLQATNITIGRDA
jgi:riboflavin synthase alpha subunit